MDMPTTEAGSGAAKEKSTRRSILAVLLGLPALVIPASQAEARNILGALGRDLDRAGHGLQSIFGGGRRGGGSGYYRQPRQPRQSRARQKAPATAGSPAPAKSGGASKYED